MTIRCGRCFHVIDPADMRERFNPGDRDEPSHYEPACRYCSPDSDDLAASRDAYDDRRLSVFREGVPLGAEGEGH